MTTAAFTNKAILTYSIAFIGHPDLVGKLNGASHADPRGGNYYKDIPEPGDWTGTLRGRQHTKDAERQVVNLLADRIYTHLGCTDNADYAARIRAVRNGTIELYSDMGPCHSCRSVIADFRKDFPALTVTVRYGNVLRGGGSAALIAAGDGLFGSYGIGDAVQGANGAWAKTYQGSPLAAVTGTFDVKFAGGADGRRFTGTASAIDRQPHSSFLYPAPKTAAVPLDVTTAVLDAIARQLGERLLPTEVMRPKAFRQWIEGVERGTVSLVCERGPVRDGRVAIAEFLKDFPKVTVEVHYPGAAAQTDGAGYTDAVDQGDGTWLKTFRPAA
ncbi:deaminase domain-containing protein [Streptomyces sp. NPDC090025]|uniref:deaminase domain-containing protein n=1 Tax=Streptomyces sp. NPDC090025 TaxID=3365922 RepID=UPI0038329EEA